MDHSKSVDPRTPHAVAEYFKGVHDWGGRSFPPVHESRGDFVCKQEKRDEKHSFLRCRNALRRSLEGIRVEMISYCRRYLRRWAPDCHDLHTHLDSAPKSARKFSSTYNGSGILRQALQSRGGSRATGERLNHDRHHTTCRCANAHQLPLTLDSNITPCTVMGLSALARGR